MCGIAALVDTRGAAPRAVKKMADRARHRGPDDAGFAGFRPGHPPVFWLDEDSSVTGLPPVSQADGRYHLLFGHRRLSIQDVSDRGHQPLRYLDRYTVIFNGEIYNFPELRTRLIRAGYRFSSGTDTEIIPAAFDRWGTDCLTCFNGMWAFVLFDEKTGDLLVSRDRLGIKPLYLMRTPRGVAVASEIKQFMDLEDWSAEPDLKYCREFLNSGPRDFALRTAFRDVRKFPAGSYWKGHWSDLPAWEQSVQSFWQVKGGDERADYTENSAGDYAEQYLERLASSVDLRLRADVPVATALSGGIDSSSIVYLVNRRLGDRASAERQKTFSSVYRSPETAYCDESSYISSVVDLLKVESRTIEPVADDIEEQHGRMIYHLDTPPGGLLMSSWFTFRLVSTTAVKVTLDGQGGDELLAGYLRYLVNFIVHAPDALLDSQLPDFSAIPGADRYIRTGLRVRRWRRAGLGSLTGLLPRGYEPKSLMTLGRRLRLDQVTLLENLLHYADRTSMAFGIESRVPFLDHRVVAFLNRVPAAYKLHDGWTKYLARKAFDGKLPDRVVWRKDKMGWPVPESAWLRGPLRTWALDTLSRSTFLKELGAVHDWLGMLDESGSIERIVRHLNLAAWHRTFNTD